MKARYPMFRSNDMERFRNKYRISSARLQCWDYGQDATYFVTICTEGKQCCFGDVVNGKMSLSGIGIIADILWHEIENHAQHIELGEFVVMPNHVHGILILNGNDPVGADNRNVADNAYKVETTHDIVVETTHDIVVETTHDIVVETTHDIVVETTHALSLRGNNQQTIGQKRFQNQGKNTLSSIIGSYKSAVSKHAHRLGFHFVWQSRFYDHIIRNDQSYRNIAEYISNNPAKWDDDEFNPTNIRTEE